MRSILISLAATLFIAGPMIAGRARHARAADSPLKVELSRLLDVGWSSSPAARKAADQQYDRLRSVAAGNLRADYAYLLVLLKQRRYPDAEKVLDRLLAADPDNLAFLQIAIRTAVLNKNHAAALPLLEKLAAALPAEGENDTAAKMAVGFMGRIAGYLAGPVEAHVSQPLLAAAEKRVRANLTDTRRELFDTERKAVLDRYAELTDERALTQQISEQQDAKMRQEMEQELSRRREAYAKEAAELEKQKQTLADEYQKRQSELEQDRLPYEEQLARLDRQAAGPRREIIILDAEIARLAVEADQRRNRDIRPQILADIARLEVLRRRYALEYDALAREAAVVRSRLAAVEQQQIAARSAAQAQALAIDKRIQDLRKSDTAAAAQITRLKRPQSVSSPRIRALHVRAQALSEYDDFPLEQAKQQLLDGTK